MLGIDNSSVVRGIAVLKMGFKVSRWADNFLVYGKVFTQFKSPGTSKSGVNSNFMFNSSRLIKHDKNHNIIMLTGVLK